MNSIAIKIATNATGRWSQQIQATHCPPKLFRLAHKLDEPTTSTTCDDGGECDDDALLWHESVKRRCVSFPVEASFCNEDGQTALHLICQRSGGAEATVEAVEALVHAYPEGVSKRDVYGRTPIFYALKRGCSTAVIRHLLAEDPDAVQARDFTGTSSLDLIYHSSKPPAILEASLDLKPSLALTRSSSFSGPTLLSQVCSRWEKVSEGRTVDDVRKDPTLSDQLTKLLLTIRAAHRSRFGLLRESYRAPAELHAALDLGCSAKLIGSIVRMKPEQARIPSGDGQFLLHIVASLPPSKRLGSSSLVLRELLEAHPAAAKVPDEKGRLPLHLAAFYGRTWEGGVRDILNANPDALRTADGKGLFPFMLAAASSSGHLETVYNLLLEGPCL